ncbi:hypothetical protein ACFL40_02125 [candidate division KSB1 bacterium]
MMNIIEYFKSDKRKKLEEISSNINLNLSQKELDQTLLKKNIEELILYESDNITKELTSSIYFHFESFIDIIEDRLQAIAKEHLISRLSNKRQTLIKVTGKLSKKGRKSVLSGFSFLPSPFLKKLNNRFKFLYYNQRSLQEDYIKLSKIISAMTEKGYIASVKDSIYYQCIDFRKVLEEYLNNKYNENYLQIILEKLNVLNLNYNKNKQSSKKIEPISNEKEKAHLKKELIYYINNLNTKLSTEKRNDFVNTIIDKKFELIEAKKMIFKLSVLLKKYDYEHAKLKTYEEPDKAYNINVQY